MRGIKETRCRILLSWMKKSVFVVYNCRRFKLYIKVLNWWNRAGKWGRFDSGTILFYADCYFIWILGRGTVRYRNSAVIIVEFFNLNINIPQSKSCFDGDDGDLYPVLVEPISFGDNFLLIRTYSPSCIKVYIRQPLISQKNIAYII